MTVRIIDNYIKNEQTEIIFTNMMSLLPDSNGFDLQQHVIDWCNLVKNIRPTSLFLSFTFNK